jgi:hypothetical protein
MTTRRPKLTAKQRAVLERIRSLEDAIGRAREYLECGSHANWPGFRPIFSRKVHDGKEVSPHKDWVRKVYLPRMEKALTRAEKVLEQLN